MSSYDVSHSFAALLSMGLVEFAITEVERAAQVFKGDSARVLIRRMDPLATVDDV